MTYPKGGYSKLGRQELLSLAQSGDDNAKIALRKLDAAMADHPEPKQAGTIDLTPTWTGVLPIIIYVLENGTEEGKRMAKLELATMAEAADRYNALATYKPTMTDDEIKNSNTPEAQAAARERMTFKD